MFKLGNTEVNAVSVIEPYGDDLTVVADEPLEPWVRPSHWPDMPVINSGNHHCAFLVRIPSGTDGQQSPDNYFTLYTNGQAVHPNRHYDFTVDWGDGNQTVINATSHVNSPPPFGSLEHEYNFADLDASTQFEENGVSYRIAVVEFESPVSGVDYFDCRYIKNYAGGTAEYGNNILEFDINLPTTTSIGVNYNFSSYHFPVLEKAKLHTPKVSYLHQYFQYTKRLRSLEFGPFDNLTYIRSFLVGSALDYIPEIDTSNVNTASSAFNGMFNLRSYQNDLDLTGVADLGGLFQGCPNLKEVEIDISSTTTNIQRIFYGCRNLQKVTGNWDTSNVTNFYEAFYSCNNLPYLPDIDFSSANDCLRCFQYCNNLRKTPRLNLPNITRTQEMFYGCSSLTNVTVEDISNPSMSSARYMFYGCSALRQIEFINSGVHATDAYGMFSSCGSLKSFPDLDMSGCATVSNMFSSCISLKKAPNLNTPNCTNFSRLYNACYSLESTPYIDITNGGEGNVSIQEMFMSCGRLKEIPNLDWSRVSYAYRAFYGCSKASGDISLNLSNLNYSTNTSNAATQQMFYNVGDFSITDLTLSESGNFAANPLQAARLVSVPYVNASGGYNYSQLFNYTQHLRAGALSGVDKSIGYYRTGLPSGAILDVFNGLASGVVGQSIDLREAPSAYILHPDTISIATSKGWTVTT